MKKTLIILALCFMGLYSFSQPKGFKKVESKKNVAAKINVASQKINTIESDFKQYKHLDILKDDIESTGHFSFKKTNLLRWEYSKPYKYIIVMNKNNMWIDDGSKVQTFDTKSNKMFKEINDLMLGLLQGDILQSKNYSVEFYENKRKILAELIPNSKEMKKFLKKISIYFDKKTYTVSMIIMTENSSDYTKIMFHKSKYNIKISDSKFSGFGKN